MFSLEKKTKDCFLHSVDRMRHRTWECGFERFLVYKVFVDCVL